jgi:hypothetical protein
MDPLNAQRHCDVPVLAVQAVNQGCAGGQAGCGNMVHRSLAGHMSGIRGGIRPYEYTNQAAETPDFPSQKQKAPRKERLSHRWTVMPAASAAWDHCE